MNRVPVTCGTMLNSLSPIQVSEESRERIGKKQFFEKIMIEIFLNVVKSINLPIQETKRTPKQDKYSENYK